MTSRRRRTRARIVLEILETLAREGPLPPTRLSYATRLPYDRLATILEQLERKGLVKVEEAGAHRKVRLTGQGYHALKQLCAAIKILEQLGLEE